MEQLIGREEEKAVLQRTLLSNEAELVAIYGRRRIGKIFLVRNFYQKELIFEFSGVHNATMSDQLAIFVQALTRSMKSLPNDTPDDWRQAFSLLESYVAPLLKKSKSEYFFLTNFLGSKRQDRVLCRHSKISGIFGRSDRKTLLW